jgi:hypothetical protein
MTRGASTTALRGAWSEGWGSGFRVQGVGFIVQGSECRVQSVGFRV